MIFLTAPCYEYLTQLENPCHPFGPNTARNEDFLPEIRLAAKVARLPRNPFGRIHCSGDHERMFEYFQLNSSARSRENMASFHSVFGELLTRFE